MNRPDEIEGYALLQPAGEGAMGEVWRATHLATGAPVAIKRLAAHASPRARALQEAEIRATAALDHPNIVRLVDTGSFDDGSRWLALEWCGGGTLAAVTTWPGLQDAILQLLQGLAHAHAHRVLHRDIKPGNLLLDDAGYWKLADFGVATLDTSAVGLVGSPYYIAPEVLRRVPLEQGPATDLYSLGCTLWQVITRAPLFTGTQDEVFDAHLRAPLPPFTPAMEVPARIEPWLASLLAKQPTERPLSAAHAAASFLDPHGDTTIVMPAVYKPPEAPGRDTRLRNAGLSLLPFREPLFLGRTALLNTLWKRLAAVIERQAAHVVVLTGAPGIGRTRLATTFAQDVQTRGLGSWGQIRFDGRGPSAALDLWEDVSADAVAAWRAGRPAVVVLDDLDDPAAAQRLGEVMVRHGGPVLWLVTAAQVPHRLTRALPEDDWEELGVPACTHGELGQLLRQALALSPVVNSQLARESDGLPGRALDTLRDWALQGRLREGPNGFELGPEIGPPLDLGSLSPVLTLVALGGGRLELALLESVCAAAGIPLDWDGLLDFVATRRARIEARPDGETLTLVPGPAVEGWIDAALRDGSAVHGARALLDRLEPDDDRRGLLLLASGHTESGIRQLLVDATEARRRGDRGRGLELVRRVLGVNEADWEARDLLILLLVDTWQVEVAEQHLERWGAQLATATLVQQAGYWVHRATVRRYRGDHVGAGDALGLAVRAIDRAGASDGAQAMVLQSCASQWISMGDLRQARPLIERALALADEDDVRAYVYLTAGRIWTFAGEERAALQALEVGLACARRAKRWITAVNLLSILGETSSRLGELEDAARYLQEAVELAGRLPNFDAVMLECNLLANDLRQGQWNRALARAQALRFDPRARRLTIARVGVALLGAVASAGLERWDEYLRAADDFGGFLERYPKLMDPDFLPFAELGVQLTAAGPPAVQAAAADVLAMVRARVLPP